MQRTVLALLAALLALTVLALVGLRLLPGDAPPTLRGVDEAAAAVPRDADLAGGAADPAAQDAELAAAAGSDATSAPQRAAAVDRAAPAAGPARGVRGRVSPPAGCAPESVRVFALSRPAALPELAGLLDADARAAMPTDERFALLEGEDDGADDDLAILGRAVADANGRFALTLEDAAPADGETGAALEVHLLAFAPTALTWRSTPATARELAAEPPAEPASADERAAEPVLALSGGARVAGVVRRLEDGVPGAPAVGVPVRLASSMEGFMGIPTGERRIQRHALTDARGAFAFDGLPTDGGYLLDVVPEDRAAVRRAIARPEPGAEPRVEVLLAPGAVVAGLVRDADGTPVAGARVIAALRGQWFGFDDRPVREATTGADGAFELAALPASADAGTVVLSASAPGHLTSADTTLELAPGERREGVVLELESGATIAGRLAWPDGAPAPGVVVTASFDRAYLMDMRGLAARRGPGGTATTDGEGRFTIRGLSAGPFSLRARATPPGADDAAGGRTGDDEAEPPEWRAHADGVEPAEPDADAEEVVLVLEPPVGIAGVVRTPDGAPVASFRASVREVGREGPGAGMAAERHARAFDADDGTFFLDGLRPATWELSVDADGFAPAEPVEVALPRPDGAEPVAVVLAPQAVVLGRVVGPLGGPPGLAAGDAEVRVDEGQAAWMAALGGNDTPRARVEADGTFRLAGLPAGQLSLVARARGFARSEPVAVELAAGETVEDVVLLLRTGGRLEGEVLDDAGEPDAGLSVRLTQMESFDIEQTTTDARGRFTAEHLVPGRWQVTTLPAGMSEALSAGGEGMGEWLSKMENAFVEITDGETSTVLLGEPPADPVRVTGTVLQGGEPWAGAILTFLGEGTTDLASAKIASVGADGRYATTLDAPGRYLVYVQSISGNMGEQNTIEFREEVPPGPEHSFDVEIPGGRISGRVEAADGSPAADARVSLRPAGGVASDSLWGGHYLEVRTDAEGRYDVSGLRAGRYTLAVGGMRLGGMLGADTPHARAVRHDLELGEDEWLRDVDFELEEPGRLKVTVVDSTGAPVSGAAVFVREATGELVDRFSLVTTSGAGTTDYGGLAAGSYSVSARKSGSTSAESGRVKVRPGETSAVQVTLEESAFALVSVRDAEDAPLTATLSVRDQDGREWAGMLSFAEIGALLGESGFHFNERRVGPLPPGRYDVFATVGEKSERRRVTLRPGDERRVILRVR